MNQHKNGLSKSVEPQRCLVFGRLFLLIASLYLPTDGFPASSASAEAIPPNTGFVNGEC